MWYVYDKATTVIQKTCRTRAAALAWRTRKQNEYLRKDAAFVSNEGPLFDWGCADSQYFHDFIEKRRVVKSLMGGSEVELTANTPRCCDPSSELYWSM
jgi:hypothetical protein